jgi:ribosomal protein S12 methylthiotransferase accessory factor
MSQAAVDEIVGRALTDHRFRARLLADGRDALAGYDLIDDERRQVLGLTADSFDQLTRALESNIERARFDGAGFEVPDDAGGSPPPPPVIDPVVLNRVVASVLPELIPPPGHEPIGSTDRDSSPDTGAWLADAAALGAALHERMSHAGSVRLRPPTVDDTDLPAREACLRNAGIIRQLAESSVQRGETRLYACSVLYGGPYAGGRYVLPKVCGARGLTPADARMLALSEAAERFAAAVYDERTFVLDCYDRLAADAVPPAAFALFSGAQYAEAGFPYVPFDRRTRINWTWGYSLLERRRVLVPAAFVYRPYWLGGHEARLADLPTTGLACGRSLAEAALYGIYEAIERDAVVITWLNRLTVPRVDADRSSWRSIAAGAGAGPALTIHDITTDLGIPVRLAMAIDRAAGTVGLGAAARLDAPAATDKAVAEALMLESIVRAGRTRRPAQAPASVDEVRTLEDHMTFYRDSERIKELDFLLHAPAPGRPDVSAVVAHGPCEELAVALGALARRSLDAIVVDVTLPEIASAGLRVVRALVPGLIPLTFGQRFVAKGGARLYQAPVTAGYRTTALGEHELNPAPYPFA